MPVWEKGYGPGIPGSGDVGVVQEDRIAGAVFLISTDFLTDCREACRNIPDHFSTDVNSPAGEIDERIIPEIVVMVMAMDYPSIKSFRGIYRIMNEAELHPLVFYDDERG